MRHAKWARGVLAAAVGVMAGIFLSAVSSQAAVIPTLHFFEARLTHDASSTDGATPQVNQVPMAFPNSSAPATSYNSTLFGANNVSSLGRAGIGWTASTTRTALAWGSNVGVSQNDPAPNEGFAFLTIAYNIAWVVPAGGTFGPPMSATFNIPVSGFVGAGGSATFTVTNQWYGFLGGSTTAVQLRSVYNDTKTWLGGTGGASFYQNFSAPAANATPNVFNPGDIVGIGGQITFRADNEEEPVEFGLLGYDPSNENPEFPNWNQAFPSGFVAVVAVPVPASAQAGLALLTGLALVGGIRRRMALAKAE